MVFFLWQHIANRSSYLDCLVAHTYMFFIRIPLLDWEQAILMFSRVHLAVLYICFIQYFNY
jgi:hypothetical protein